MIACFRIPMPLDLPSPNHRLHWGKRAAAVKHVRTLVALVATSERNRRHLGKCQGRRELRLIRHYVPPQRELDRDNLMASLKPCVDGLKDAGWILDDKQRWLELHSPRQVRGIFREIGVEIADCDEET